MRLVSAGFEVIGAFVGLQDFDRPADGIGVKNCIKAVSNHSGSYPHDLK